MMKEETGTISRGAILALAGLLVVALAVVIGLNVGGLREELLWRISPPRIQAIAVLPVDNLSQDPAQDYFAQGMTITLISDIGTIKSVRVAAVMSINRYRKAPKPPPEVARDLNVDAVVQCGVLRTGDRIRLVVNLIHAPANRHLWGRTYERDLSEVPSLRGEVSLDIARRINAELGSREEAWLSSRRPVNPKAQDAMMRGMWGGNPAQTEDLLKQAVQIDAAYAHGYDFLALMYSMRTMYPASLEPRAVYPKAREAAQKAVESEPNATLSHRVLATVALEFDWNFGEAEKEFKTAVEVAPHSTNSHHMNAHYLLAVGRSEEAAIETRRAIENDPMNAALFACASWHEIADRDYDEAEKLSLQALRLGAPDRLARLVLGWSYQLRGRHDEAIPEFQKAVVGWNGAPYPTAALGHAYAAAGQESAAREVLGKLLARSKTEYVSPYEIAVVYAGLDDRDRAFEWLDKAFEERATMLVYFRMDPRTWGLHPDARFQALLRRMNFPQTAQ